METKTFIADLDSATVEGILAFHGPAEGQMVGVINDTDNKLRTACYDGRVITITATEHKDPSEGSFSMVADHLKVLAENEGTWDVELVDADKLKFLSSRGWSFIIEPYDVEAHNPLEFLAAIEPPDRNTAIIKRKWMPIINDTIDYVLYVDETQLHIEHPSRAWAVPLTAPINKPFASKATITGARWNALARAFPEADELITIRRTPKQLQICSDSYTWVTGQYEPEGPI